MSTEYTSMERSFQPTGTMGPGAGSQAEFAPHERDRRRSLTGGGPPAVDWRVWLVLSQRVLANSEEGCGKPESGGGTCDGTENHVDTNLLFNQLDRFQFESHPPATETKKARLRAFFVSVEHSRPKALR